MIDSGVEIATRSTALRAAFLAMTILNRFLGPSLGLRAGFAQDGLCGYWGFSLTAKLRRSIIYIKLTESE